MISAIRRTIKLIVITSVLCFGLPAGALGQVHDRFEGWCDSLQNAKASDLVDFLNSVQPNDQNARCIFVAIRKVGNEGYEQAIPALVRLLDFRRPATRLEKMGYYHHPQGPWEMYPAVDALAMIGERALPQVLSAIKAKATSPRARENAVFVVVDQHRPEPARAIVLFRQEAARADDPSVKQRMTWAIQKALSLCGPQDESACRQAASISPP